LPLRRAFPRRKATISAETRAVTLTRAVVVPRWEGDSWPVRACACGCGERVEIWNPACWHHIFPKRRWPELIDVADNLILVAVDCHASHETARRRFKRAVVWPAERLAVTEPMRAYLDRTYGPRPAETSQGVKSAKPQTKETG
jgi:hypothetical protein